MLGLEAGDGGAGQAAGPLEFFLGFAGKRGLLGDSSGGEATLERGKFAIEFGEGVVGMCEGGSVVGVEEREEFGGLA